MTPTSGVPSSPINTTLPHLKQHDRAELQRHLTRAGNALSQRVLVHVLVPLDGGQEAIVRGEVVRVPRGRVQIALPRRTRLGFIRRFHRVSLSVSVLGFLHRGGITSIGLFFLLTLLLLLVLVLMIRTRVLLGVGLDPLCQRLIGLGLKRLELPHQIREGLSGGGTLVEDLCLSLLRGHSAGQIHHEGGEGEEAHTGETSRSQGDKNVLNIFYLSCGILQ